MSSQANPLSFAKGEAQAILDSLTERQAEVLSLAAQGNSYDAIAYEIGRSRRTVEEHVQLARKKLRAKNRIDAIRKYIVLLTIVGEPTCGFIRVELSEDDMERLLRDLSFERAVEMLSAPEFEQFKEDFRAAGPEGLTARYGGWWKLVAGAALALLIIGLLIAGAALAPILDAVFAGGPS